MWKGLSFLLPFLFGGYIFQAYNSYVLHKMSISHPDAPWQVSILSLLFLVLFVGNTLTTLWVVPQKLRGRIKESYRLKSVSWAMKIRQQIKVSAIRSERKKIDIGWLLSRQLKCISHSANINIIFSSQQGEKAEKIRLISESHDDGHFEGETSKNK